jgi:hypothetical protein
MIGSQSKIDLTVSRKERDAENADQLPLPRTYHHVASADGRLYVDVPVCDPEIREDGDRRFSGEDVLFT